MFCMYLVSILRLSSILQKKETKWLQKREIICLVKVRLQFEVYIMGGVAAGMQAERWGGGRARIFPNYF